MVNSMRRAFTLGLTIVLTLSLLGVVGCATSDDGTPAETKVIKVGVQTALTGPLPDYGDAAKKGCELALEDFGAFEIDGQAYQVELVILDDKAEPAEAAVVAQTMIDEGVVGAIGSLTTGATLSAIPVSAQARIPLISGSVTGPNANEAGVDTFFRTCWSDAIQGQALGAWAIELGAKKVVVMDDNGAYSVALGDVAEDALKASGVETLRQNCQSGDKDLSAQVANIREFGPDVVIFTGYHPEAGLLRKQMCEAGMAQVIFMGGDGIRSEEFVPEAGGLENSEGVLATFGGFPEEQQPGYAAFAAKYKEKYGSDVGPYAQNNYDAVGVLVAAIKAAGSAESEAIMAELKTIQYDGVTGTFGFASEASGDVAVGDIVVEGLTPSNVPRYAIENGIWVSAP